MVNCDNDYSDNEMIHNDNDTKVFGSNVSESTSHESSSVSNGHESSIRSGSVDIASNSTGTKKRKISSNNANALLIAEATAETLESLNIDPESKEGKKTKRRIRNRMSAQHHRDRKNQYIQVSCCCFLLDEINFII